MSIFRKALGVVGVEIEPETETSEPEAETPKTRTVPPPRTTAAPVVTAEPTETEVTVTEATEAQTLAFRLAGYGNLPLLQRYMTMEAKSKVADANERMETVLSALQDAADIKPTDVISQANTAHTNLERAMKTTTIEAADAVKAESVKAAEESKALEAAIAADAEQIRLIEARMQRAQAELAGLSGKYAASTAAINRKHIVFVGVAELILNKLSVLAQRGQR